jgi:aspartyl protease family protein
MVRFVVGTLFVSLMVGAMMPGKPSAPSSPTNDANASGSSEHQTTATTELDLGSGAITLDREPDGHFYADVQVNGMPVRFVVDTGASGIALSRDDAQRAGILLGYEPRLVGSGASGDVYGHVVELDRVNLGIKEVRDVTAVVLEGGRQSLLGQSFLAEFDAVSIEGDRMVLR